MKRLVTIALVLNILISTFGCQLGPNNDSTRGTDNSELELLPPELELAIMKKLHAYDKIMNVQLMPANTPKDKQADDVTGEWLILRP